MNTDGVTPRVSCHKLPPDIDQYQLAEYRDKFCKVSMRSDFRTNYHFSGPDIAIGPVCVCLYVRTTNFEQNDL